MKKILSIILLAIMIFSMSVIAFSEEAEYSEYLNHIHVKNYDNRLWIELDGEEMTFTDKPFIDAGGRTQIPVREFCEQLGHSVTWIGDEQRVSVTQFPNDENNLTGIGGGYPSIIFSIGERKYSINDTYYDMDTEAQIINNRTYVPLRYLAEALNCYVAYNFDSYESADMEYGYSLMNSYLGLDREAVLEKMGIDENNLLKTGDEAYPILKHMEGSIYIVKNGYKNAHVVIEFYNDALYAFYYVFQTEDEAFDEALKIYDFLIELHGEAATYPGIEKTIAKIGTDESQFNDEVCSYYDEWHIDASKELIETMLGDSDNALMKMLKLDINPRLSTVRVNFTKDVNYHNRSVLKIMDKDHNYIITDGDVVSCKVKWLPDGEHTVGNVTGVALEIEINEKARNDFKEATKKISEYPGGENYLRVIVDGIEISKPAVMAEIDSDKILVTAAIGDYEAYKGYAEKINAAIRQEEIQ